MPLPSCFINYSSLQASFLQGPHVRDERSDVQHVIVAFSECKIIPTLGLSFQMYQKGMKKEFKEPLSPIVLCEYAAISDGLNVKLCLSSKYESTLQVVKLAEKSTKMIIFCSSATAVPGMEVPKIKDSYLRTSVLGLISTMPLFWVSFSYDSVIAQFWVSFLKCNQSWVFLSYMHNVQE